MPELGLVPCSGLEHLTHQGGVGAPHAGMTLSVHTGVAIASVMARKGQADRLAQRGRDAFGIAPPNTPRRETGGGVAFVWTGPGQWLATAEGEAPDGLERRLRDELENFAAICDQSDGRTLIRVGGTRVREALAKGLLIDLHPRAFGPNHVAATSLGHIPVLFWQLDDEPRYEFAVFRSFAADLWTWLAEAAAAVSA